VCCWLRLGAAGCAAAAGGLPLPGPQAWGALMHLSAQQQLSSHLGAQRPPPRERPPGLPMTGLIIRPMAAALMALQLHTALAAPLGGATAAAARASAFVTGHGEGGDPTIRLKMGTAAGTGGAAAWAAYSATYSTIGWDVINVTTSPHASSAADTDDAMFAAGYLEGHLSQKAIYDGFQNIYSQFFTLGKPPPAKILAWVGAHMEWVEAQVKAGRATSAYWASVGAILAQLRGLAAGYAAAAPPDQALTYTDLL
jgi:hypothetical protein